MRRSPTRIVARHGLAVAAAVLTILMFAAESRGRATVPSSVKAQGYVTSASDPVGYGIELELYHPSGTVDLRRALRDPRSGPLDVEEFGDEALVFGARLRSTAPDGSAGHGEHADCLWTDATRTQADCQLRDDGEDAAPLSLTVVRGASTRAPQRTRDIAILISRPAASPVAVALATRLTVLW